MIKIWVIVTSFGLLCGFMIASTTVFRYFFAVVSRLVRNDEQKGVAAMTGFLMGQFVMFTSIYDGRLYQIWIQPHNLIMLFIGAFLLPFFWTNRKTLRNAEFWLLHPEVLNTFTRKGKCVLRPQLEFMLNFVVQLWSPHLKPDSMVSRFVSYFIFHYQNENQNLFIVTSFVGWVIAHIFFMILFEKLFQKVKYTIGIIIEDLESEFFNLF